MALDREMKKPGYKDRICYCYPQEFHSEVQSIFFPFLESSLVYQSTGCKWKDTVGFLAPDFKRACSFHYFSNYSIKRSKLASLWMKFLIKTPAQFTASTNCQITPVSLIFSCVRKSGESIPIHHRFTLQMEAANCRCQG